MVAGHPDSGKTSWFTPFQGMLTNADLLFISEKLTAIICSEILFTKNLYHIETNQFITTANQLSVFYHLQDFAERYFGTNDSYLTAIYSFFKNWIVLRSRFKQCGLSISNRRYYKYFGKDGSLRKLILWSLNSLPAGKNLIWSTILFSACFKKKKMFSL